MKFNLTHKELKERERSVYSQGGQDGVLETIFDIIGTQTKFFVEFGAKDGVYLSNTANLRINHRWTGLLMDAEPEAEIVRNEMVTAENIAYLFYNYGVSSFDYLSIDIDGNDYWIWEAITYSPRVVTIEYNAKWAAHESKAIKYDPSHVWMGDDYYGASLLALKKLGERKGYTLVHVVDTLDAVFIRNDFIDENYVPPTVEELLPEPVQAFPHRIKKWVDI